MVGTSIAGFCFAMELSKFSFFAKLFIRKTLQYITDRGAIVFRVAQALIITQSSSRRETVLDLS